MPQLIQELLCAGGVLKQLEKSGYPTLRSIVLDLFRDVTVPGWFVVCQTEEHVLFVVNVIEQRTGYY